MSNEKQAHDNEALDADNVTADAVEDEDPEQSAASEPADEPVLTDEERQQRRLVELEAEVADLTDSLLRKSADFDNYRKRTAREKQEFMTYANRELLLDIVTIIDDFERAIRSADESDDFSAFHDGIVMIEKQFASMLERKWKLSRFDSVGEEFDPQRHEAMMTEEVADHEQSMVLEDFQKGYMLHEKVLRPAKVKVSMPGNSGA